MKFVEISFMVWLMVFYGMVNFYKPCVLKKNVYSQVVE